MLGGGIKTGPSAKNNLWKQREIVFALSVALPIKIHCFFLLHQSLFKLGENMLAKTCQGQLHLKTHIL